MDQSMGHRMNHRADSMENDNDDNSGHNMTDNNVNNKKGNLNYKNTEGGKNNNAKGKDVHVFFQAEYPD